MRTLKYLLFFLLIIPSFLACEEDEDEGDDPERLTVTVTLSNESGAPGCGFGPGFQVTYLVSYRDIQVSADINDGTFGIINVLVEDGESINVKVYSTADDTLFADANVDVRTTSRPEHLEGEFRRVTYCEAFDLQFDNF